jgi:hypothetical protein
LNPFATLIPLIFGAIGLEGSFEMRLGEKMSLYIPVDYLSWPAAIYGNWGYTYLSLGGEIHYYLADTSFNFMESDALRGFWVGGGLNIQFWSYNWSSYYTGLGFNNWSETVFTIPIHAGYKFVFGKKSTGFYFEPYLGFRLGFSISNSPYGDEYQGDYTGFEYGGNIGFCSKQSTTIE